MVDLEKLPRDANGAVVGNRWEVILRAPLTDGLIKQMGTSQTEASTGANGDALSFDKLDLLIDDKVKVRDNTVFLMPGKLKRKFFALMRGLGGATPEMMAIPGINRPVPTYRGIPILQCDWIATTEAKGAATTLSSVYLASLGDDGFSARYGSVPGAAALDVDADPRRARVAGFRVRAIGELEGKEVERTRISWYGAYKLGSQLAAARLSEIITA